MHCRLIARRAGGKRTEGILALTRPPAYPFERLRLLAF
jgi:hypothetical protein